MEDLKKELHILLGVIEGVMKYCEEDGSPMALMLRDALVKTKSPDE